MSQAGFAATAGLLYAGAEERGEAFQVLLLVALAVAAVGGFVSASSPERGIANRRTLLI